MVRFLINRPIAVFLSFLGVLIFSVLSIRELPISLLPSIEVPSIIIKVDYPNNPARLIENSVLDPIRSDLNALNGLKSMESTAGSETGLIELEFEFGTRMDLAYIEINEKIDRLQERLPRDLNRPRIVRVNTSDIPVIRLQLIPKNTNMLLASELAEKVLKKRIEQLEGVSIVDVNGLRRSYISIQPRQEQIEALGISAGMIQQVLQSANQELGTLSIKDGQYRYFVKVANRLDDIKEIEQLPVQTRDGQIIPLIQLAKISTETQKIQSYHLFNGQEGLVVTIHKQASAKMTELMPKIYEAIELFKTDYPQIDFDLTQDQSNLLNAGIDNLSTSLIYGGIFAFLVLFLFMGNYRLPLIMGFTLPTSLLVSFLLFYAVGLSINIISLSGLALGLGMLIDNAIIVIDNITRKKAEGLTLVEACIQGVNEVMAPLISSVLTTLAVFVPLVFLNGLSGALFYDQALSVAIILVSSLMVAFILLPLLYRAFFSKAKQIKEDSWLFRQILKAYKWFFNGIWRAKGIAFIVLLLLIPTSYLFISYIDIDGLPEIEKDETLLSITWNDPIDVETNRERMISLFDALETKPISEAEVGLSQFLLNVERGSVDQSQVYFKWLNQKEKEDQERWLQRYLSGAYPNASITLEDAPNAFDQIFENSTPDLVIKWRDLQTGELLDQTKFETLNSAVGALLKKSISLGQGFVFEETLEAIIDTEKLSIYGIDLGSFKGALIQALEGTLATQIQRYGEVTPIRIERESGTLKEELAGIKIRGSGNTLYNADEFIKLNFTFAEKNITADRSGIYQSLEIEQSDASIIEAANNALPKLANEKALSYDLTGKLFEDEDNLKQLLVILGISVALLYFILAAQFESLVQPIIVILTLPLGIMGALVVLWLSGSSLNVMSAIGIIVMLGIMVNDAILKIDTINRLKLERINQGMGIKEAVTQAIARTGEIRLKPILMTSITTILALLPIVFSSGIGADLQTPLVFAVIGGLTIGTFTALFFVPLAYWFFNRRS